MTGTTPTKPDTKPDTKKESKKEQKFFRVTLRHSPALCKTGVVAGENEDAAWQKFCEFNSTKYRRQGDNSLRAWEDFLVDLNKPHPEGTGVNKANVLIVEVTKGKFQDHEFLG